MCADGTRESEQLEESLQFVASDGEPRQALVAAPGAVDAQAPGIVIIHGLAGTTRPTSRPVIPELVRVFVDRGIGVVRYFPRVFDWPLHRATRVDWNAEIADARGALRLLRDQSWLDQGKAYLLGMSLGGMVAPVVAKDDGAVAGIASWGSTARPFPRYAVDNLRIQLGYLDKTAAVIERMASLLDEWYRMLCTTDLSSEEMLELSPVLRHIGVTPEGRQERSVDFWRQVARFAPADSYSGLGCRILVVRGQADCCSHPEDQESIVKAARASGLQVESDIIEGIDHRFVAVDDSIQSANFGSNGESRPAVLGRVVARWIRSV